MQKRILKLILVFLLIFPLFGISQTQYNDGQIRLRVWVHKVWSSANCSDPGVQEYVFRDIRVRPRTDILGTGWSPNGVNIRTDMSENRWRAFPWTAFQIPTGSGIWPMSTSPDGILLLDISYPSTAVPTSFDWSMGQTFENDCGSDWHYENSCGFLGLLGDETMASYHEGLTSNPFRSAPEGQKYYVQTDIIDAGSAEDDRFAVIFAFQWDLLNPLPPLPNTCGFPKYQDGNVNLDVQLAGVWSDIDYDMGAECIMGLAGDEDLRIRYRSKDNLSPFSSSVCINQTPGPLDLYNQNVPQWNTPGNISLLSKSYSTSDTNFESFELEFETWEEDPFPTNEFVYENDDDAHLSPLSTGPINWRNSPPNKWNYLDIPIRAGNGEYENWTMWIRYKWTQGSPVIITQPSAGGADRTLCIGTPTTLTVNANSTTFYQWQVTDVTGPAGPACPSTGWTDITGAYCPQYTPPQTPGTRIYRCMLMNRTGTGSTTPNGDRLKRIYTDCVRITYYDFSPVISSLTAVCNSTVLPGSTHIFSIPAVPSVGASANATFTWSVTGPATVTPTPITGTSTTITFPSTPGIYTIYCTVNNTSLNCAPNTSNEGVSTCIVTVTEPDCGIIHASPSGNPTGVGTESDPVQIQQALFLANSSGGTRNHIKVLAGTYNNVPKLIITSNDLLIDGDYEIFAGKWRKNSSLTTTVNIDPVVEVLPYNGSSGTSVGVFKGVEAVNVTGFTIQDIIFNVKNGVGSSQASGTSGNMGLSVYGYYFRNCNGYNVRRCVMNTGGGTNGTNGTNGAAGVNGSAGGNGASGDCDDEDDVGDGGAGGSGGGGTWAPGQNVDNSCCNNGQNGTTGGSASSYRNGGSGGSGASAGSENHNGGSGGDGGNGGGSALGGSSFGSNGISNGCSENSNSDGRAGQNGNNGVSGANASATVPATSNTFSFYWLPNGQSANGADGAGGGGGEGGGGGGGQGGTWCDDGAGSGGGGGGGGGQGGQGGTGGWGGGSSFAIYTFGAGTGTLSDVPLNQGSAGNGGALGLGNIGGVGGLGGIGGGGNNTCFSSGNCLTGGRVCGNAEVGAGGKGGNGGNGGDGGKGQFGAAGLSIASKQVNSSVVNTNNVSPNASNILAATTLKGCTNSEIVLYKSGGNPFDFPDMGNPELIDDISFNVSSYSNFGGATQLLVSYPVIGNYKITLNNYNSNDWDNFIVISEDRPLPSINGLSLTTDTICTGQSVDLSTNVGGAEAYEWNIQQISAPSSPYSPGANIYNGLQIMDPAPFVFNNPGPENLTFQIKLHIKDNCCGWSKPVYKNLVVVPELTPGNIIENQIVCYNTLPTPITSLVDAFWGVNPINYTWEQSVDSVNWYPAVGIVISGGTGFQPTQAVTGTIYYRRLVDGGPCGLISSNVIIITALPELFAGNIGYSHDVCYNTPASPFVSLSSATGGSGSFSYIWQISPDCNGIWTDIPGAFNDSYSPPGNLISDACYRRAAINTACPDTVYTNTLAINVHPQVHPGVISGDTVLCQGTNADTIISVVNAFGGYTGFTYTWEQSDDGGLTWVPAIGTPSGSPAGIEFIPATPSGGQTILYRRIAENTSCQPFSVTSNSVSIQVVFNPIVDLGVDLELCSGNSAILDAGAGFSDYIWNTSATNQIINVSTTGNYSVTVTDTNSCQGYDTVFVNIIAHQIVSINSGLSYCINAGNQTFTATPVGGIWTGTGISGTGIFNPQLAGIGVHVIIYTATGICGDADTVLVSVNPLPIVNLGVDFYICSGNTAVLDAGAGYNYLWNTSDISQTITVNSGGTYFVTITDANGCHDTDDIIITLINQQDATILTTDTFCSNDIPFQFNAVDSGGVWSGTGITTAGLFSPLIAGPGSHNITYVLSGLCGDSDSVQVIVNPVPSVSLGSDFILCAGDSAILDAGVGFNYLWNTTDITQTITLFTGGTYIVTITDANACQDSDDIIITLINQQDATILTTGPFCSNDLPVQFIAVDSGGIWSGTGISTTGFFTPLIAGPGSHNISYVLSGSCGDADTAQVIINPAPVVNLGADFILCSGDSAYLDAGAGFNNYFWNTSETTQIITLNTGGNFLVTVTDGNSCQGSDEVMVTLINQQDATILTTDTFCSNGSPVQFISVDSAGVWSGTGITPTGIFDPIVAGPGVHNVNYTITGTCGDSDSIQVNVNSAPIVNLGADFNICSGESAVLDAGTGFNNYIWNTNDITQTITIFTGGTYLVTISDVNNCQGTDEVIVTLINQQDATILTTDTFCSNDLPVQFMAANTGGIWSGTGISPSGLFNPELAGQGVHLINHIISGVCGDSNSIFVSVLEVPSFSLNHIDESCFGAGDGYAYVNLSDSISGNNILWDNGASTDTIFGLMPGVYNVTVTAQNGCHSDSSVIILESLIDCFPPGLYIPNVFSPNDDGLNDILFVRGKNIESIEMFIYDRWGEKIFETTSQSNGWDGTYKGKKCEPGVFVYRITVKFINHFPYQLHGNITLVR
ncbi:MAG: gliding motility-associated C-terminal domain-containing protein [Bacteroidales bacterium]|nr:gliding motility-associated C-terminal domain-containing protein [Bacteroidales bacterium]